MSKKRDLAERTGIRCKKNRFRKECMKRKNNLIIFVLFSISILLLFLPAWIYPTEVTILDSFTQSIYLISSITLTIAITIMITNSLSKNDDNSGD